MKKTERLVYYYDLSISANSRTFPAPKPISVRKAFELMQLVPIDKRTKSIAKESELLYISDWKISNGIISILINKSDKGISDPVFTIPEEKKRRTAEKTGKEGQDFSVHLVIRLPNDDLQPALVIVEHCNGLGVFTILKLLNQILSDATQLSPGDFEQTHPDGAVDSSGKPKKYNVVFKCIFDGHISDDLKHDLDHGKFQSIELITEKDRFTSFDDDGYIVEKCKTLVLTLDDSDTQVSNLYDRILRLIKKQNKDYSKAKIKFKTETGLDRTVNMDTAEGLALAYVKKEKLDGFNVNLESSYEKFNNTILAKMEALLSQET
ncbi:hypothetical protein [Methyloglobulus sp.]|uniref:hypothetical protein n=1 Tax=Methyloglobulus sp. TaxID=2518622 RepID=UPI0032B86478